MFYLYLDKNFKQHLEKKAHLFKNLKKTKFKYLYNIVI